MWASANAESSCDALQSSSALTVRTEDWIAIAFVQVAYM